MRKLMPFRLDPVFEAPHNPQVPCDDCGKLIAVFKARIVMVDLSEKGKAFSRSLDEWARNISWTFLCRECWLENYVEPGPERIH